MNTTFSVAILGSGSRGCVFGICMQGMGGKFKITAVCDTNNEQLEKAAMLMGLDDSILFNDEDKFFEEKRADVITIATPDK